MDNHVMYYFDDEGELSLSRCYFCKKVNLSKEMTCKDGYDCQCKYCQFYMSIDKKYVSSRLKEVRYMMNKQKKLL